MLIFALQFKANHNKDYSVVKTFKAAQVAFFYIITFQYFAYEINILLISIKFFLSKFSILFSAFQVVADLLNYCNFAV
jgi:hypothetical protein